MKKKLLFIPLFGLLLAGCSFEDLMFWKKKDDDSSQKEGDKDPGDSDPEIKTTTKTINFYGDYMDSNWKAPGVSMDSTLDSCKTQNERLLGVVNNQVSDTSLLSELYFTKLNTGWYDATQTSLVLQLGGGSGDNFTSGTLTWTSTKKIYKGDVEAQYYTKTGGATESSAYLNIEAGDKGTDAWKERPIENSQTKDRNFAPEEGETLTYKTCTNSYTEGITRFRLTSLDGRMFLKSLTITWGE